MADEVITQLRAYLDYASREDLEQTVAEPSPDRRLRWYQRGPVPAVLAAILVLGVGVPALLLTSDPGPPAASDVSDPLDVGVERVWPDAGFPGGPDEIAAAFAEQALGWTDVETVSDPAANADGPVWTTIRHRDSPDLGVLSVPIDGGLRVLMQVGGRGTTVGPTDDGNGQRIELSRVEAAESAVLHIRFLDPDRVEVVTATESDLNQGEIEVDSKSLIGGIVTVYFNADGEAITAVGGHYGPFVTPPTLPETTPTPTSTSPTSTTAPFAGDPSQTAEDAERDGVLVDLAALPLELRSHPLVTIESEEGTWMLSQPSPELDAVLGDSSGDYGVDFISPFEYGELLLVDRSGDIERAYPMTAFPPSWLLVTDSAVYLGRVGDGGLPWSAIGRVDRATLEAQFLIFPTPDTQYDYWPPDWDLAPDGYDRPLVTIAGMEEAPTGSFVQTESWIGNVHVDLEGIEELFDGQLNR